MTYNKLVNGEVIAMTEAEIAERQAEEAAYLKARPMQEWQSKIAATDAKINARVIEDLIDVLDGLVPLKDNLPQHITDVINERKTIRSQKPKG